MAKNLTLNTHENNPLYNKEASSNYDHTEVIEAIDVNVPPGYLEWYTLDFYTVGHAKFTDVQYDDEGNQLY